MLYMECGRFDLLNKLYQASGQWEKALYIARHHDRLNFSTTHYKYANYLESIGDFEKAKVQYEQSQTQNVEVPRMLYDAKQIVQLQAYVKGAGSKELWRWMGRYWEFKKQPRSAIQCYKAAKSHLDLTRLYVELEEWDQATQLVESSNDRRAAFHLAQQYEFRDEAEKAIRMYATAKAFNEGLFFGKQ